MQNVRREHYLHLLEGHGFAFRDGTRRAEWVGRRWIGPDQTLAAAHEIVREMADHKYGSVIVAKESAIAGVFTTVDALKALGDIETWEEIHPW